MKYVHKNILKRVCQILFSSTDLVIFHGIELEFKLRFMKSYDSIFTCRMCGTSKLMSLY